MSKILVIGDSWSSAVVAGNPNGKGWPELMGIPEEMRQAVAGSTAVQWAADFEGRLTKAMNTEADIVILSLLGNDLRAALADGTLTVREMRDSIWAFRKVVSQFQSQRVIVLLYADPSGGTDPEMAMAVELLNTIICSSLSFFTRSAIVKFATDLVLLPEHFAAGDGLHPNEAGHEALAEALKFEVEDEI